MNRITEEKAIEKNCNKKSCDSNKRFYGIPYPSIYFQVVRLSCPLCNKQGNPKIYKNIWKLRYHFSITHTTKTDSQCCKNTIGKLVDYIRLQQQLTEQGVLR